MTELVFTPSSAAAGYGSLLLSDGNRELELIETVLMDRVFLAELDMPVVADEDTYATSPDMEGSSRIRTKPQNAEGGGRLWARATSQDTLWELVDDLEDLAADAHRRKGTLTYTPPGGTAVTYQLEAFHLTVQKHEGLALGQSRMEIEFAFTSRPYGLLDEVTLLEDAAFTGPIDFSLVEGVPGHVDALGELTITDDSGEVRDDIEWGIDEGFDFDDAYEITAAELDVSGYSGSFDTDHVEGIAQPDWLALCSTAELAHIGRYRIKVRLSGTAATACEVRVVKRDGGGPPETNSDNLAVPHLDDALIECDCGIVNIREAETGTQAWTLSIELKGDTSQLDVYSVLIIPASRYGRARAPFAGLGTPTSYDAFDSFDEVVTGGSDPLDAMTSASGDTWATHGDATDFEVEDTDHTVFRAEFSDASGTGRWGVLGANAEACGVQSRLKFSGSVDGLTYGLTARYVDASNNVRLVIVGNAFNAGGVQLVEEVAGVVGVLGEPPAPGDAGSPLWAVAGTWYTLTLTIDAAGNYSATAKIGDASTGVLFSGQSSNLATGGALESGKSGIYDENTHGSANSIRSFDDFAAWEPPTDHVIWDDAPLKITNRSAQRRHASVWGDVPSYEGKRMLLPPATRNDYPMRLVIKQDRNDLATLPVADSADSLLVGLTARGRVLLTTSN